MTSGVKTQTVVWPRATVGDLCRIVGGGTPSKKNPDHFQGQIPWATVKDFTDGVIMDTVDHVTEDAIAHSASNLVPAGTVLVVTRVGLGKVAITGKAMAINQDVKALFPGSDITEDYLYWCLVSKALEIVSMGVGATVKGITLGQLKGLSLPLPPLDEQRRIVDILKRADSIRRLRKQALETMRELIPALFVDMFGDPATNPKGWAMITVGEILSDVDYGTSQKATEDPVGLPVLRMGNVTYQGDLDLESIKYAELTEVDRDKYLLQAGDLLFNRTNSKELVGKLGMWDGRFDAVAASYFIRLRADRSICHPIYLWAFFNTRFMKQRLFETARGAIGQSNINAKELKAFPVALPPLNLQESFADHIAGVQALIQQQAQHLAQAEALRQSLMAQFFN